MAAALDDLVARVVGDVVVLVALEQVVGRHLVAADQEALQSEFVIPSGTPFQLAIKRHLRFP